MGLDEHLFCIQHFQLDATTHMIFSSLPINHKISLDI